MAKALWVGVLVVWMGSLTGSAASDSKKDKIAKEVEKISDSFREGVLSLRNQLLEAMVTRQAECQKQGELDGLKAIDKELAAFEEDNALPKSVPTIAYRKSMSILYDEHLLEFQKLVAKYPGTYFERTKWVHTVGRIEKVNALEWVEHTSHGTRIAFRQAASDLDGVMLVNNRTTICLLDDHCDAKNGAKKRGFAYRGGWKN